MLLMRVRAAGGIHSVGATFRKTCICDTRAVIEGQYRGLGIQLGWIRVSSNWDSGIAP